MCLAVITTDARGRLVICANRDEYHERTAEALHWWPDQPGVAGGRDRVAAGSWLAVHRDGRFAMVLNGRDGDRPGATGGPSRGQLVARYLVEPGFDAAAVAAAGQSCAAFHWLGGDRHRVAYVTHGEGEPEWLAPAAVVCGNWGPERTGPRLHRVRAGITEALQAADPVEPLFAVLADDTPLADAPPGPANGDTRPVFIRGESFGTRCSSIVIVDGERRAAFHERRFDAAGAVTGERSLAWCPCDPA